MGTYAMKPTFSTTAGGGVKAASIEFDTIGYYFARCMEDLQLITDVLGLPAEESIKKIPPKEARVGFVKSLFWSSAGSGTIAAMEKAAETLRKHGVTVGDVDLSHEFSDAAAFDGYIQSDFCDRFGSLGPQRLSPRHHKDDVGPSSPCIRRRRPQIPARGGSASL